FWKSARISAGGVLSEKKSNSNSNNDDANNTPPAEILADFQNTAVSASAAERGRRQQQLCMQRKAAVREGVIAHSFFPFSARVCSFCLCDPVGCSSVAFSEWRFACGVVPQASACIIKLFAIASRMF